MLWRLAAYSVAGLLVYVVGNTLPNLAFTEEVLVVAVVVIAIGVTVQIMLKLKRKAGALLKRRRDKSEVIRQATSLVGARRLESELKEAKRENARLAGHNNKLIAENKALRSASPVGDKVDWDALVAMDDSQRRQWVMAGAKFAKMNDGTSLSPVERAIRWVRGNRTEREA